MNSRLVQWVSPLAVAAAAFAMGISVLVADELPEGKPVKHSEPSGKEDSQSALPTQGQKDLLNRLQPQQPVNRGSLQGLPAPGVVPPPRAVIPNAKTQELLDRRKDWIFTTPEQLILGNDKNSNLESENPKTDEVGNQKLTPMEEFYINSFRQSAKTSKDRDPNGKDRDPYGTTASKEGANAKDDSRLPQGLRDREDQLKRLILSEAPNNGSSLTGVRADGNDFLGTRPVLAPSQSAAQKARMEEYRQIFGLPSPQDSWRELLTLNPKPTTLPTASSSQAQSTLNGMDSIKASDPSGIFTSQNQVGSVPTAPQLADINARVLNPSILNAGGTRLDTKPVQPNLTPPTPTFAAPRRIGL